MCTSSYFGWSVLCCTFQPPTVSQGGFAGTECYRLAMYQGVRVLSLTTVLEVRFAGLAILRAQQALKVTVYCLHYVRVE